MTSIVCISKSPLVASHGYNSLQLICKFRNTLLFENVEILVRKISFIVNREHLICMRVGFSDVSIKYFILTMTVARSSACCRIGKRNR